MERFRWVPLIVRHLNLSHIEAVELKRLTNTYYGRLFNEFCNNHRATEPSLYCFALLSEFCRIIRSSSGVKRRFERPVVSLLGERHLQNIRDKIQIRTRAANKMADTTIAVVLSTAIRLYCCLSSPNKCRPNAGGHDGKVSYNL